MLFSFPPKMPSSLSQQIQALFPSASINSLSNSSDRAFLWDVGNDFLSLFESETAPTSAASGTFIYRPNASTSITLPGFVTFVIFVIGHSPSKILTSSQQTC